MLEHVGLFAKQTWIVTKPVNTVYYQCRRSAERINYFYCSIYYNRQVKFDS